MLESHGLPMISFVTLNNFLMSLNFNSTIFRLGINNLGLNVLIFVNS